MVKICPKCTAVNFNDEKTCYKCGNSIVGTHATSSSLHSEEMKSRMILRGAIVSTFFPLIPIYGIRRSLALLEMAEYADNPPEREELRGRASEYLRFSIGINIAYLLILAILAGLWILTL
jgi:hypothetical protein